MAENTITIIKEVCKGKNGTITRVVLRTTYYNRTLANIENLFAEAKTDFPKLESKDVDVMVYQGMYYKGTYGIEFNAEIETVPEDYSEIHQLEYRA